MSNATVSRLGQIEAAGSATALFLKLYAGEVLAAFETAQVAVNRHLIRTIPHGKSAQFPAIWKNAAQTHTPGAEIVGQAIKHDEVVISLDGLVISDVFLADIDEAMNHYDVRAQYTKECGIALATEMDKNVLRCGMLAADTASNQIFASLSPNGTDILHASMKVDATVLAAGIFNAAQTFDESDVPASMVKSCFLRPAQYFLLAANKDLLNKDWGGQGSYADAVIPQVAGIELVKTNNLPITNETGSASVNDAYEGNWSTKAALITAPYAVATVKLIDLKTEMAYDIRRQGTLIVAKYACGHGALRPECAISLSTS
jgi:hypothetical protein